jgi:hypothetical protein
MTAELVDFRSGHGRPYKYAAEHICGDRCQPNCERKPYRYGAKRSEINRHWRIADFSIVGFEGFGYEITELAQKAAWSVVHACAGFKMDLHWTMACNDAAMDWTKGAN